MAESITSYLEESIPDHSLHPFKVSVLNPEDDITEEMLLEFAQNTYSNKLNRSIFNSLMKYSELYGFDVVKKTYPLKEVMEYIQSDLSIHFDVPETNVIKDEKHPCEAQRPLEDQQDIPVRNTQDIPVRNTRGIPSLNTQDATKDIDDTIFEIPQTNEVITTVEPMEASYLTSKMLEEDVEESIEVSPPPKLLYHKPSSIEELLEVDDEYVLEEDDPIVPVNIFKELMEVVTASDDLLNSYSKKAVILRWLKEKRLLCRYGPHIDLLTEEQMDKLHDIIEEINDNHRVDLSYVIIKLGFKGLEYICEYMGTEALKGISDKITPAILQTDLKPTRQFIASKVSSTTRAPLIDLGVFVLKTLCL